jgi:hypothetical protein
MRKHWSSLLRIGVTLLGLAIIFRQVDLGQIWQTLVQVDLYWVLAGVMLVNASLIVRAYRWFLLLRRLGAEVRLTRLTELYFVGNFFNAFLPSGFGGDVVRVLEMAREVPAGVATGTVILDRLTGLFMLFVMAVVIAPWRPDNFPTGMLGIIIAGTLGGVFVGWVLMERRPWPRLSSRFSGVIPGSISRLLSAVRQCGWRGVLGALAVSALFNLMLAGWWLTSGLALDQRISFGYLVLVMPILSIPLLVPSISGLGPRELLAPTLFAVVGMSAETAVSLSLLVFVINRLSGLFGAPLYLYTTLRESRSRRSQDGQSAPSV